MKVSIRFALLAALATSLLAVAGASPAAAATVSPAQQVPGSTELRAVACATPTTCYAVGFVSPGLALMVPITNGLPGAVQVLPGPSASFSGVACASATTCYVVGTQLVPRPGQRPGTRNILVPIVNGVLGTPVGYEGPRIVALTCVSATTCYGAGDTASGGALVPIVEGVVGTPQLIEGIEQVSGVACPSATTCYVTGTDFEGTIDPVFGLVDVGVVVQVVDGVAGPPQQAAGTFSLDGIACTSTTSCYVLGQGGFDFFLRPVLFPVTNGILGAPQVVEGVGGLSSIACPSATRCEAVGSGEEGGGVVVPIVDGVAGAPVPVAATSGIYAITCASAATCVAVGFSAPFPYKGVVVIIDEAPTTASACRGEGWKLFRAPAFKNQGACVSSVQAAGHKPSGA